MSESAIAPDTARAILTAALGQAGLPPAVIAVVAAAAPALLEALLDLVRRHHAGEPLPEVAVAKHHSTAEQIAQRIEEDRRP